MKRNDPVGNWLLCARLVDRQYEQSLPPSNDDDGHSLPNLADMVEQSFAYWQRLQHVSNLNWQVAREQAVLDYQRQLRRVQQLVTAEIDRHDFHLSQSTFRASRGDLIRDLCLLEQEFAQVRFDPKANLISVTTKPIELENLELGEFEIALHLETLACNHVAFYEVVAINANCASSNDDVIHPHVQSNRLCEGEAQPAIRLALQQGRLLDFFQLVEQVLSTYNAASAYVTISEWHGTECDNCGHYCDPDALRACDDCEANICNGCGYGCKSCGDSYCSACTSSCEGCGEFVCNSCSASCADCEYQFCKDCLNESERCDDCEKKANEKSDARPAEPAVHTDSMGEVAVPA